MVVNNNYRNKIMMDIEFENYWRRNQKRLILNAPQKLREEYLESTKLNTPMDWICFVFPIAVGVFIQPYIRIGSEILSWIAVVVIVVVIFFAMELLKPFVQKKKTTLQALDNIRQYYYERYKKYGLEEMLKHQE